MHGAEGLVIQTDLSKAHQSSYLCAQNEGVLVQLHSDIWNHFTLDCLRAKTEVPSCQHTNNNSFRRLTSVRRVLQ